MWGESMSESKTKECVLIVGDWFVDEHWVFGLHRSPSSSRTGRAHYRALNPVWNEVRAFCGTGRSAFFLHHVRNEKDRFDYLLEARLEGVSGGGGGIG